MLLRRKLEIRVQDSAIQIWAGDLDMVSKTMIVEVSGGRASPQDSAG